MSEKPAPVVDSKLAPVESPEKSNDVVCETKKSPPKRKKEQVQSKIPIEKTEEVAKEMTKVHEVQKTELQKNVQDVNSQNSAQISEVIRACEMPKAASTKDVEDDVKNNTSKNPSKIPEENSVKDTKPLVNKTKKIPVVEKTDSHTPWNAAVPRTWAPISAPSLKERPLVLTTHLVPSMPIGLFEILVEIVEVVTKKPVVLLHEPRIGRPVAKDIADIAILPASEDWKDGVLLPASFVFKHYLNKSKSPCVYADVIVAADRAPHVEDIMDLRGHRCAVPDRRNQVSAAGLLFNYLRTKGENPAFFGNTLDASSQLAVLQMVAGKQAEVGILEAPVIGCHKFTVSGAEFLHILTSLGPLPPYRIMLNKALADKLAKEIATYLLSINQHKEWMDRLSSFGVIGFAENSTDYYNLNDVKSVLTSVPYY
ncbi:uncharacterized protein LOC109852364 [Pseudomyrmex gracilis]|uniref:uncharacterized protein LOC109852364 n=1 Tax=Pseudomyrmex gracilis TaxID=219809 RepID=UPI000995146A|nr:uncharacterized protein LOC109852364 [Pseudomyrmex gracilis]